MSVLKDIDRRLATYRNHKQLRRLESAHGHNDLLGRMHLVHASGGMIKELHTRRAGLLSLRVPQQPLYRRIVQHVEVGPIDDLLQVSVVAGAAQQVGVERGCPLLDSGAVARVVVVHDRNVGRLTGVHEGNARRRDVALVSDLERAVAVGRWVPRLVCVVEAFGLVLRVEVSALYP